MRYLAMMNGWKLAPHEWRTFLFKPIMINKLIENGEGWFSVSVFGFIFFFGVGE